MGLLFKLSDMLMPLLILATSFLTGELRFQMQIILSTCRLIGYFMDISSFDCFVTIIDIFIEMQEFAQ